ncbi:hypothetical protein HK102_002488, partial [Quaeritorhiza haematococci]
IVKSDAFNKAHSLKRASNSPFRVRAVTQHFPSAHPDHEPQPQRRRANMFVATDSASSSTSASSVLIYFAVTTALISIAFLFIVLVGALTPKKFRASIIATVYNPKEKSNTAAGSLSVSKEDVWDVLIDLETVHFRRPDVKKVEIARDQTVGEAKKATATTKKKKKGASEEPVSTSDNEKPANVDSNDDSAKPRRLGPSTRWREYTDLGYFTYEVTEFVPLRKVSFKIVASSYKMGGSWTYDLVQEEKGNDAGSIKVVVTENSITEPIVLRGMIRINGGRTKALQLDAQGLKDLVVTRKGKKEQ